MQQRRLGRTDLHIAPLVLGGNVFGWTADAKTSFAILDRVARSGPERDRHGGCLFSLGARQQGRGIRDDHRRMDEEPRQSWGCDRHHQGRLADGPGQERTVGALCQRSGRGLAQAPAERFHRSLSLALAGRRDALRGDARRLRRSSASRAKSARSAPRISTPRNCRPRSTPPNQTACRATTCCSPNTISTTAALSMVRCAISAWRRASASSPISVSPRAFCRANIVARRILAKARAAAASKPISMRGARGFSARSTRSPAASGQNLPKSPWPG